jgi:hypothetical protein
VLAGSSRGPLAPIPSGSVVGHGCDGWRADTSQQPAGGQPAPYPVATSSNFTLPSRSAPFAVAGSELFLAGSPACPGAAPAGRRPVFERSLPSGRWHVWRTFAAGSGLALAGRGHWLALAIPATASTMTARVFDLRSARQRYQLAGLPAADLALDESGRLLLGVPDGAGAFPAADPALSFERSYRVLWASPDAPHVHRLGSPSMGMPAISRGRIAYVAGSPGGGYTQALGNGTLIVVDVHSGATRAFAGFEEPQRNIYALDLRGTQLAWIQSEGPAPDFNACYRLPVIGTRHLQVADITAPGAFVPAPVNPPPPDLATLVARCGPVPP